MQYEKSGHTYLVRLETDEEIIAAITQFVDGQRVDSASITALGTVHHAVLGYFDRAAKKYVRRTVEQDCELVSLVGNISLKEGKPYAHVHVTLGTRDFQALAGHLFEAKVAATCELVVQVIPGMVQRKEDPKTGLWLWDV